MVLGLGQKSRKSPSVRVDYIVHIQDIKPWPPSQSLRSLRSVVIQWENGEKNSGSTSPVVLSLGTAANNGKIEFNETFRLAVTLLRDTSVKSGEVVRFRKNCLDLHLYELRRDKTSKGQFIGTAIVDLADHGIIKESRIVSAVMNCQRNFRNTAQPVLHLKIHPASKSPGRSLSLDNTSILALLEKNDGESVSALMKEEYAQEVESTSFTEDAASSQSFVTVTGTSMARNDTVPPQKELDEPHDKDKSVGRDGDKCTVVSKPDEGLKSTCDLPSIISVENYKASSSCSSSVDLSADLGSTENCNPSCNSSPRSSSMPFLGKVTHSFHSAASEFNQTDEKSNAIVTIEECGSEVPNQSETLCGSTLDGSELEEIAVASDSKENAQKNASNSSLATTDENFGAGNFSVDHQEAGNRTGKNDQVSGEKSIEDDPVNSDGAGEKYQVDGEKSTGSGPVDSDGTVINDQANGEKSIESEPVDSNGTVENDQANGEKSIESEPVDSNGTVENDQANEEKSIESEPVDSNGTVENDQANGEKSIESEPVDSNGTVENDQANGEKSIEDDQVNNQSDADSEQYCTATDDGENHQTKAATTSDERLKYVKSVRSTPDLNHSNGAANGNHLTGDGRENEARSFRINERHVSEYPIKDTRSRLLESKVQQLENKIQMMEGELREAAAIEFALFSVVAEHGSSMAKVHAPARRLSRLFFYACELQSQSRRAFAAKSAVSGLVLVAKACGNDVSRLTYWLSNSVMLRVLVSQRIKNMELSLSSMYRSRTNSSVIDGAETPSLLRWNSSSFIKQNGENFSTSYDWEDPLAFVSALEKVEAWIFSRTVESIWWQTFTPCMQSSTAMLSNVERDIGSSKSNGEAVNENDESQVDYSLEIWRTAFKDAFRRLCPVRAEVHECGCLQFLPRLVMEQCIARLDVAMFNAILRESPDEMSMDPVSDPISDPKVLPIPAGQSSFGTGAQLKNMIGNWSRCLTELVGGADDCNSAEEEIDVNDHGGNEASFKCFHLLSAVSDLMMLPKDMLLSESVRKEVCPMFSTSMIGRILHNFVPDEFCPDPIPDAVFESLDAGDHMLDGEDFDVMFPHVPSPMTYVPPSTASIAGEAGHLINGSSVLAKSITSDDELEELNSPLALISIDQRRPSHSPTKLAWISKRRGYQDALRYELLRDTWKSSH